MDKKIPESLAVPSFSEYVRNAGFSFEARENRVEDEREKKTEKQGERFAKNVKRALSAFDLV